MSEAFDILTDARIDMASAEASLTLADQRGAPESAVEFRQQALNSVHSTIKRLRDLEKVIEYELTVPAHASR